MTSGDDEPPSRHAWWPWFTLLVPLLGGVAARDALTRSVSIGTVQPAPKPYGIDGQVFAQSTAGLIALRARNPARPVGVDVPEGATMIAIDPAERVYWAVGSRLHVQDLLTHQVDDRDAGGAVLDGAVSCDGLVALTSTDLVTWTTGGAVTRSALEARVVGISVGRDCEHITAWTHDDFGEVNLSTGHYEPIAAHPRVRAAARSGHGWLSADSDGVAHVTSDGTTVGSDPVNAVSSLCGTIDGRACIVLTDGDVRLLP